MTYRVLVNGSAPSETNRVIANIEATDVSALICWVGIIDNDNNCNPYSSEQTYCETVYVGENTTTEVIRHTGTTTWHGITIWYTINQSGITIEPDCESATTTSCVTDSYNVWVSPYVVSKEEGGHNIKFYVDYLVETRDACNNVINVERVTSSGCPITDKEGFSAETEFKNAIAAIECTDTDRTVSAACRLMDIVPCLTSDSAKTVSATCYVAEEENCCENESGICYEISEITYSPTSVPFSGGDVYYSFDYKKKTTVNCVTSTKVGTYTSSKPWRISGRTVGEQDQCLRKQVTSSFTPSLDDFITCDRIPSSSITLSIWQGKNSSACTESSCTESIGYCIDKLTIRQSAYTINDVYESSGTSTDKLEFPSYGGKLKVVWEYSAITIYDDCSSAVTSGNTWEDVKTIDPYNGNDYFLSGDTRYDIIITAIKRIIQNYATLETVANLSAETIDGKEYYVFKSSNNKYKIDYDEGFVINTVDSEDRYEIFNDSCGESGVTVILDYEFKTPSKVCESGNTFQIQYYQYRPPCVQDCPSCMGDGEITLDCGYSAMTDDEGKIIYDEDTGRIKYSDEISGVTAVSSETHCHVESAITETICSWLLVEKSGDNNFVFSAKTANSGSSRSCKVTFDLGKIGDDKCTETVTITQLGSGVEQDPSSGPDELKCPCRNADGLYFGVYSLGTIPYKGGSPYDVASYGYDECVSAFTLTTKNYDNIGWFTHSGITSAETDGETEGTLSGDVECNCDCDHDRFFELEYTYAASDCSGESGTTIVTQSHNTNCKCNKITAATDGVIASSRGSGIVIGTYQLSDDCPPSAATISSTTASFISNVKLSNTTPKLGSGNILADVDCNYCNSSDRSGDITITYKLSPTRTCTTSFTATQKAGVSATLTPSSNLPFTSGNGVTLATFSFNGDQSDFPSSTDISASVSDTSFITNVGISNNSITGNVDCNYCNNTSRTNVVTLKYKKGTCECEKTCIITQNAGTSATLTPYDNIPSSGGNSVILATYQITGDNDPTVTASSNKGFINPIGVDRVNKTITGNVSSNYCSGTSRDAIITMKYSNGGCECTKTCNVTQKAGTSAVLVPSGEIPCIGGEDLILATYLITGDDNPNIRSITPSDTEHFHITSYADGVIKGNVSGNCCEESVRTCDLSLTYGPTDSVSCTKTCELTQKRGKTGKKITCTDSNYSPIDCSENPIETTSGGTLYLKLINDSNNT